MNRIFCNTCKAKVIDDHCKCGPHPTKLARRKTDTPDTHHLDTALKIFGSGKPSTRRAMPKLQLSLMMPGHYIITYDGRALETGEGSDDLARQRAEERRVALSKRLGREVELEVFQ